MCLLCDTTGTRQMSTLHTVAEVVVEGLCRPARYIAAPNTPIGEIITKDKLVMDALQVHMPGCSGRISDVTVYVNEHQQLVDPASPVDDSLNGRLKRRFLFRQAEVYLQSAYGRTRKSCTTGCCFVCRTCMKRDRQHGFLLWLGGDQEVESEENFEIWYSNWLQGSHCGREGEIDLTNPDTPHTKPTLQSPSARGICFPQPWAKFVLSRVHAEQLIELQGV